MSAILIRNATVLPMTGVGERYFRGSVGIAGGRIVMVSAAAADADDFARAHAAGLREIDAMGMVAMPGLVNTHGHVSMTLMRGYADDLPLMPWLTDHIWPFEARMDRDDIMLGARLGIAEMLLGGTTTFTDMYWQEEAVAEVSTAAGIRAVLSPTFTDASTGAFMKDLETLLERYGGRKESLVTVKVAPHSVYTCSPANLRMAGDAARRHGLGINIHVSETVDEQNIIRERYGKTPTEHLDSLGLLGPDTLVVHAVWLSPSDIELIGRRGASVSYNPQSNMKLASGVAPVAGMLQGGVNVAFGTDGPSSNNDLDMWEEMRTGALLQKVTAGDPCMLPAYRVLEMATAGGARALGLGDVTGQLKPGLRADVILVDMNKPHLHPATDPIANLVYCGKSSDVHTVIIDGKIVVDKGECLTIDTAEIYGAIDARVGEIANRL